VQQSDPDSSPSLVVITTITDARAHARCELSESVDQGEEGQWRVYLSRWLDAAFGRRPPSPTELHLIEAATLLEPQLLYHHHHHHHHHNANIGTT
jgi:hypothetical protein